MVSRAQRVGQHVRAARARAGYTTLPAFAAAAGVSETTISNLELGVRSNFKDATLWAIEAEIGWPTGEIRRRLDGKRPSGYPEDLQTLIDLWPHLDRRVRAGLLAAARAAADQKG
ncbi:MAG TPA: helix-turn-helix transcriptional regulator [Pseudonocardiaceae bacterium]|nr:helix-turn-helix transcriptional regulator [Pseudonocardiaceae bacterium]